MGPVGLDGAAVRFTHERNATRKRAVRVSDDSDESSLALDILLLLLLLLGIYLRKRAQEDDDF